MRSLSVRARRVRLRTLGALSLFTLLFAVGCGGAGGGASPTEDVAAVSTLPVDLPPGQTTAQLAWAPSEGQVVGYLVFQSRGEEAFVFLSQVVETQIQITGAAGDSIRILVVAQGASSAQSVASVPSPPVRFHAAVEAASALAASSAEAAIPAAPSTSTSTSTVDAQADSVDSEASPADEADSNEVANSEDGNSTDDTDDTDDEVALLDQALRERLLRSDLRLPFDGLSPDASRWIQSFVDAQVGAGVSLAGLGELAGDALRDLVWMDSSGQLFVSQGAQIATTEDPASTFVEAIRLRATERFAGLADFDGDGVAAWIVEDTATDDIWILNDDGQDSQFACAWPRPTIPRPRRSC